MPGEPRSPAVSNLEEIGRASCRVTKTSIGLQDLRRKIYLKVKTDSVGTGGVWLG